MYLIFDTETTGFVRKDIGLTDRGQARITQLAWLLLDREFNEVDSFCKLIKSNGKWTISEGAAKVTGHTTEQCDREGVEVIEAMNRFNGAAYRSIQRIAHNLDFDKQLIQIENTHLKCPEIDFDPPFGFCTMKHLTPICRLKGKLPGKFKWPKLQEAYVHCFKEEFIGAHDALADVRATARIFKWIKEHE